MNQILNDFKSAVVSTRLRPLANFPQGQGVSCSGSTGIFHQLSNFGKGSFGPLVEV